MQAPSHYLYDGERIDPQSEAGQARLFDLHGQNARLRCPCCSAQPEMYLAKVDEKIFVKRMPETGHLHSPDCVSFDPPDGFSGRGELNGSAIVAVDEDHIGLRLGFPMSKGGLRAPPAASDSAQAAEVAAKPNKLGITALLHYLWDEAALNRWVPAMAGKRSWRVVRGALWGAAEHQYIRGRTPLRSRLFVPEHYNHNYRHAIVERRTARLAELANDQNNDFGILVAEYKKHSTTQFGAKFTFKHLPDLPFFVDKGQIKTFERVTEPLMGLLSIVEDAHLLTISTFGFAKAGYPELKTMGFMVVDANWLPIENWHVAQLTTEMCKGERAFITSLRYNLQPDAALCTMMATDTTPPVMMFIEQGCSDDTEAIQNVDQADLAALNTWIWDTDHPMPELPTKRDAPGGRP